MRKANRRIDRNQRVEKIRAIRQVVTRPVQASKRSKALGVGADSGAALRSLSSLNKTLIKAQNACVMTCEDLQDIRYQNADSIQSSYENTPRLIKSIQMIKQAEDMMNKARDLVGQATKVMRGEMDGNVQPPF